MTIEEEVGVAAIGVGGVESMAERGVDWREEERRSRGAGLEAPFLLLEGAMTGLFALSDEGAKCGWMVGWSWSSLGGGRHLVAIQWRREDIGCDSTCADYGMKTLQNT